MKKEKLLLLWECTAVSCVKVTSKRTGTKKRILVHSGRDSVSFTPKEFNALKKAIKKGDL